jgi:hypothetical protein
MAACGLFTGRGVIINGSFMSPRGLVYLTLNFVEQGVAADLKHFGVEFLCSGWQLGERRHKNPGEPMTRPFCWIWRIGNALLHCPSKKSIAAS